MDIETAPPPTPRRNVRREKPPEPRRPVSRVENQGHGESSTGDALERENSRGTEITGYEIQLHEPYPARSTSV